MNLRQFFINQTWWGKLIGAFFGFLMAGPAGALFGVLIGNFFDRGLTEHFSKPFWHYHYEKNKTVQHVFFEAMFSILGHIAKSDGRVSEQAIQFAQSIMHHMELNPKQKRTAQLYFNEGKTNHFNLIQTLIALQKTLHNRPTLIRLFIDTQYQAIKLGGVSQKKLGIMNTILNYMQLASLYEQNRFSEEFGFYSNRQQSYNQSSFHQEQAQSSRYDPLEHAYTILQIKSSAPKQEVKRAYRKLMSRNHPDKLIAQSAPESKIKEANDKTQKIRKAYELICSHKGW
ncbi:co-chaperone DjlA [bacterium]|nr:co-chaperone DjlA [bacterium]